MTLIGISQISYSNPSRNVSFQSRYSSTAQKTENVLKSLLRERHDAVENALSFANKKGFICIGAVEKNAVPTKRKNDFMAYCDRIVEIKIKDKAGNNNKLYDLYFMNSRNAQERADVLHKFFQTV